MQTETLQVVDEVIMPGDGGKKVVDFGGALFARNVENIAHARILAHWRV
jgi:hypothetical protein